jgi:threonylcarbamoyladenosine tRNA methylthiotransferase MtaB
MHRKYDLEYYSDKIAQIRAIFPLVNITTDIMTGFSGETAADFENTLKFVDSMDFGETHIFPYSRRVGTPAFNSPDQVDEMTKHYRVNELLALNHKKAWEYRQKFEGQVLKVIVERNRMGLAYGHSANYLEIEFPSPTARKNDLVEVIIVKAGYPVATAKEVVHV